MTTGPDRVTTSQVSAPWWWRRWRHRPFSVPVWWAATPDRWADLRILLLAERGLTEEEVGRV